ncbi:hypothetical protein, partial [Klebsiella aerogenes]|uniref:hypothetical protein n=1 Tax=Klebsiella aerogenes TaxID=548 RepID=UPI001CC80201
FMMVNPGLWSENGARSLAAGRRHDKGQAGMVRRGLSYPQFLWITLWAIAPRVAPEYTKYAYLSDWTINDQGITAY